MYLTCIQGSFQHDPGVTHFISCKDKLTSCTLRSHSKATGKSKESPRTDLWEQTKKVFSKSFAFPAIKPREFRWDGPQIK